MGVPNIVSSDLVVQGTLTPQGFNPPANSIGNAAIVGPIAASKLQHEYEKGLGQDKGAGAAVAQRRIVHVVRGATGTLQELRATLAQACTGNATITIDLFKNGATILSATVVVDNGVAAYGSKVYAGFTSTALAVGDVLEFNITVNAGTGVLGQGLYVQVSFLEDAN